MSRQLKPGRYEISCRPLRSREPIAHITLDADAARFLATTVEEFSVRLAVRIQKLVDEEWSPAGAQMAGAERRQAVSELMDSLKNLLAGCGDVDPDFTARCLSGQVTEEEIEQEAARLDQIAQERPELFGESDEHESD